MNKEIKENLTGLMITLCYYLHINKNKNIHLRIYK